MTDHDQSQAMAGETADGRVFLVTPDAMAVESPEAADAASAAPSEDRPASVTDMVEQPDKIMRIGTMTRTLLEEIKSAPLDEASRKRVSEVYAASIEELKAGLDPKLAEELERITEPFTRDGSTDAEPPSDAELRIAQAQLVGWLEGLFRGIQTALFAQQMAARQQLEQIRRALPGPELPPGSTSSGDDPNPGAPHGSGMYL